MVTVEPGAFPPAHSSTAPPQFFVNQKRGEINELRGLLASLPPDSHQANRKKRRDALKRLVNYMTMGIDVSPLFPEVILACATSDPVQKKLLALYLGNYAEQNAEVAVLAINAFQKDLRDVDPRLRGLALRALASLRVETVAEYAERAILDGLNDPSSYVRRSAIVAVLKFLTAGWARNEAAVAEIVRAQFMTALRKNLLSVDPPLFVNALLVLDEIDPDFATDRKLMVHLFNKFRNCDFFGRSLVFSVLSDCTPRSEEELVGLLGTLESQLALTSPSVAISALKTMLCLVRIGLSAIDPESSTPWMEHPVAQSCLERGIPTLLNLATSSSSEISFSALAVCRQLVAMGPAFGRWFCTEWELLMPRFHHKAFNQVLRLEVINRIADEANWTDIRDSLVTFATPPMALDPTVFRTVTRVLCNIALAFATAASSVVEQLFAWHRMEIPVVSSATLPMITVLLARYPSLAGEVVPFLAGGLSPELLSQEALSSYLWLIGAFGQYAPFAPDVLSALVETLTAVRSDDPDGSGIPRLVSASTPAGNVYSSADVQPAGHALRLGELELLGETLVACTKLLFVNPQGIKTVLATTLAQMYECIDVLPPLAVHTYHEVSGMLLHDSRALSQRFGQGCPILGTVDKSSETWHLLVSTVPVSIKLAELDTIPAVAYAA